MAWTLNQVTAYIVGRREQWMARADLSVLTSANPDILGPVTIALMDVGVTPAVPMVPDDNDVASVADAQLPMFLALVDLRVLEAILGNFSRVDESVASQQKKYDQFRKAVMEEIARVQAKLKDEFGFGKRKARPLSAKIAAGKCWPPDPPTSVTNVVDEDCTDVSAPQLVP